MSKAPHIDQATAMMVAADYVEQEERYNFFQCEARYCETQGGCPGAWIAYVGGLRDANAVFEWLGFNDFAGFASVMTAALGSEAWPLNPTLAATGLRRLARERCQLESRQ